MSEMTWEQAVQWLREQPDQQALVRACYFDDPLVAACERFAHSGEWRETARYLAAPPGQALDVGAGRGIATYALAASGWQVTALEPDASDLVGAGAIRQITRESNLPITVVQEWGERLPFNNQTFDLVYARQVLHHARDLAQLCCEVARVLKPGGTFIAVREHVISRLDDLPIFLSRHDLHHLYGGEHAYQLETYRAAIEASGLSLHYVLGHWQSEINFFPMTAAQWQTRVTSRLRRRVGDIPAVLLTAPVMPWSRPILSGLAAYETRRDDTPGRLYSFVARKGRAGHA